MASPVAQDVSATQSEDGFVFITLTATDSDAGSDAAPSFSLANLPAHGTLWVVLPIPGIDPGLMAETGTAYAPDFVDAGSWGTTFYFIPDANWSGDTAFQFTATDSTGETSAPATATITLEAVADAPVVDPNAHDQPDALGPAFPVTTTSGTGSSAAEDGPQLAALDGGGFVMVWQVGLTTGQILARTFNADGTPDGDAFTVSVAGSPSEIRPAVAALDGGGFVAVWMQAGIDTGGFDIRASIFGAGQTSATTTLTVTATSAAREVLPTVTAIEGGFVVTWAVESGSTTTIRAQRYDATGAAFGSEIEVTTTAAHGPGSGSFFMPPEHVVTGLAGGGFVVSWSTDDGTHARVVRPNGSLGGDVTLTGAEAITAFGDGFIVTWTDDELRARIYDADGQPTGPAFALTDDTTSGGHAPVIAVLPDGRFVVAWRGDGAGFGTDIFAAVYLADGTPNRGGPIQVTNTGSAPGGSGQIIFGAQPTITVLTDGSFAVGWIQPFASGGMQPDVFVRAYDPGVGVVSGPDGDPLPLPTTFALVDQDGSEVLAQVRIEGLPDGFRIGDGTTVIGGREGGDPYGAWIIGASDAAFLVQLLTGTAQLTLLPTPDYVGDFTLAITATSRETQPPVEVSSVEMTSAAVTVPVSIFAANDSPVAVDDAPNTAATPIVANRNAKIVEYVGPASVLANDSDPDAGETAGLRVAFAGATAATQVAVGPSGETAVLGTYGTLYISADGSYRYVLDNRLTGTAELDAGEQATEQFVYTAANGGGPDDSDTATLSIVVEGVNDSPSQITLSTPTVDENAPNGTVVGTLSAYEPEGDPITWSMPNSAGGRFALDPQTGVITVANGATLNYEVNQTHTIGINSSDGRGGFGPLTEIVITLNNLNEAPHTLTLAIASGRHAGTNHASIGENADTTNPVELGIYTYFDDALGAETVTLSGPDAAFFQLVGNTVYLRAGLVLDYEAKSSYSVTINVDDPAVGGTPDTAVTLTLSINDVDEPSTVSSTTVTLDEDATYSLTLTDFPFDDPEGERSIRYVQFQQPTNGSFWYDPTGGDHSDAFKLTGQFNLARVDIASGGLFFRPDANENGTPYASFSYRAFDGEEFTNSATLTFNVTAVNDAPQWSNARSGDYAEGETILFSRDITISDVELDAGNGGLGDFGPGSVVRLRRSTGAVDEDVFGFDTTGASFILTGNTVMTLNGDPFATYSSFHGTLTIAFSNSGAIPTRALVHDVLRRITYTNTRDDLPDDRAEFRWTFFDSNFGEQGTGGELTATALTELNFHPVNDGPENAVPNAQSVGEDTDLVFRSSNGNALRVSDPDSGDRDIVVELRVAHGTLTLGQTTGLSVIIGNGTAALEMRGTLAEVNAALEGLIYRPAANYVGSDTLFVHTDDFGHSGSGDPEQDEDSVAITVERVNDAPQAADVAASGAEDTAIAVTLSGTDSDGAVAYFRIATLPANGALFLDAVGTIPIDPDQVVASNGIAVVYFVPAANFSGDTGFEYFAIDGEGLDGNVAAVSISVAAANDAPLLAGDRGITVAEGGTVALTTDDLTATDPDNADTLLVYTVTGVSHGTVLLNGVATSTFTQADLAAGDVSFAHDGGEDAGSIALSMTDGAAAPQTAIIAVVVDPHGNDAPVAQDGSASGDEDTVIAGAAVATDADDAAAALSYSLVGANGGALHGSVSMNGDGTFSYTPFADFNGIDTFAFRAADAAGADSTAIITVTVDPVKDSPEGNVPGNATPYIENQAPLAVDPALTVSDPDSTDLVGATVAITGGFVTGEDVLVFADQNGITGSFNAATGVLTLSGTSSLANYQAALRSVAYSNTSDDPSAAARTVSFQVDDGGGLVSLGVSGMTVIPVNDAPVNTASAVQDVAVSTDTAIAGLSVADLDAGAGAMTTTLSVAHGTLTVASAGGAAVAGSGTATVTLTGTLAQINTTLAASNVIYRGAAGFFGTDTLTVTTDDGGNSGTGGALGDADQVAIEINTGTPGNDSVVAPSGSAAFTALGGNDTVTFNFRLVDATVSYVGNTVVIDTATSHTVLSGVETYVFTDGTVNNNDGSWLIDDLFYYSKYHDVWNAHADADAHYNSAGWHEGRDPSAFFQTAVYLSANPDVTGVNPLDHWHAIGWTEGRVPSIAFDPAQYLAANPDVAAAHADPLAHFLQFGAGEGRLPFAPSELVTANGFDYVYYLQHNPDVAAAGVDPFHHFMTVGWTEGRNPNALFDVSGYLANYADVQAAHINPLAHYDAFGWDEGRDPSPDFDTTSYLAAYPDVQAASVNPFTHFLSFGIHEGRSAFADGLWG